MDGSRRPGNQPEGRPRTILSPYDPVHASTGSAPPVVSQRHFLHRHQENIDSTVSVVETIAHVTELYPGLQSRLPGPSSITNVGLSPVAHQPFVQLHPPPEPWLLPGIPSHPLLPVSFPHSSHRPVQASAVPSEPGIGRDHLSFISSSATGAGTPGVTRDINPMPFSPTEPENGNLERERNSLQADRMLSHPPGLPHGHGYGSLSAQQHSGPSERQFNHPQQPPTNMHASTQQSATIQLISPPPAERRRPHFMTQRSRRGMESQFRGQTSRVDRQHIQRSSGSNGSANRSRVEGHSRRNPPWATRAGQTFLHATASARDTYMNANLVPNKPPPSKRALLSLEPVEISELPEDDRTCIICYNDFGDKCPEGHAETPLRLPRCKHVFGDRCITKWLEDSDNCPYCRDRVGRVRTSESSRIQYVEMSRGSPDGTDILFSDPSDELLQSFFHVGTSQLRHLPVYARLGIGSETPPPGMEEQNRHRAWTLQSRNSSTPNSEAHVGRAPAERDESMITPPPLAASEVDPTIVNAHTPTQNHFNREDMMATPLSTVQRVSAQESSSVNAMPEHSVHVPRPRVVIRDVFGTFRTHASTQTMASSPESPLANMEQNLPHLPDFPTGPLLFDSHPEHVPGDHPIFLPSFGNGSTHNRSGRGRRC